MPWSVTESDVAVVAARWPTTSTVVSGGEKWVAFSMSSESRWARSTAALPPTVDVVEGRASVDAGEVLDLADGGADDVGQRDRAATAAGRLGAGQHQQRLGVAAHAGGEVVEPEEVLELVGVVLVGLELVDELDLAVEQRLVAAGQVDEDVADALAEQRGLLGGDLDRTVLHAR